jgi:hypothetical protein
VGTNGKALPGENGKGLGGSLAKQSAQEIKPSKVSRQARSGAKRCISASGPAELGEPAYTRQQLGTFHEKFVANMRAAIAGGTESAVERTVKSPGTQNPRPISAHPDRVLP